MEKGINGILIVWNKSQMGLSKVGFILFDLFEDFFWKDLLG